MVLCKPRERVRQLRPPGGAQNDMAGIGVGTISHGKKGTPAPGANGLDTGGSPGVRAQPSAAVEPSANDRAEALPLLGHEEKITASCSEAGYYTFATGNLAAELMFADHEPIPELQRALSADEGPADLTMLRGRCLAALDPELGVGHVGRQYNAAIRRSSVSDAAIDEIDRAARMRCLGRLENAVAEMSDCSTQGERSLMRDITQCLESSFETLRTL
jgi:hypothetical protein